MRNIAERVFEPPDHREGLTRTTLSRGWGAGRRWCFELFGAPLEPVDRRYLPSGRAHPLLTGHEWSLRLELSTRPGIPSRSEHEVSVYLRSAAGVLGVEPSQGRRSFHGPGDVPERQVIWSLIRPDEATKNRIAETYAGEVGADAIAITSDSRVLWVRSEDHIVTEWRPLWAARSSRWVRPGAQQTPGGTLIELDGHAHVVRVESLPRVAPRRGSYRGPSFPTLSGRPKPSSQHY
jgi:hypothetical protein